MHGNPMWKNGMMRVSGQSDTDFRFSTKLSTSIRRNKIVCENADY
jgi:hypothetical protein